MPKSIPITLLFNSLIIVIIDPSCCRCRSCCRRSRISRISRRSLSISCRSFSLLLLDVNYFKGDFFGFLLTSK